MNIKTVKKRTHEETITMRVTIIALVIVAVIMTAAYFVGAQFRDAVSDAASDAASDDAVTNGEHNGILGSIEENGGTNAERYDTAGEDVKDDVMANLGDDPGYENGGAANGITNPVDDIFGDGNGAGGEGAIPSYATDKSSDDTETDPPETDRLETDPPVTEPPETDPPETKPPETTPPVTEPPETTPPVTEPPETTPPETKPPETELETLAVYIDGELSEDLEAVVNDGVAFVPIGKYTSAMDAGTVRSWNGDEGIYTVTADGLHIEARAGDCYIVINGRALFCPADVYIGKDNIIRAPVEILARAFNASATMKNGAVYSTSAAGYLADADAFYNADDLYWLSHIINAEAGTEPFEGKLAVGAVIMNRVSRSGFPDTIEGVVFDNDTGIQFSPAYSGSIYKDPNEESIIAAKLCLEGYIYDKRVLFFSMSDNSWASKNREYLFTIDGHDFYA